MPRIKLRSVLIAVHDRALSQLLRLRLNRAGFTVFSAFDGEQARILAARQRFELMIADVELPEMSGFGFCQHVREDLGLLEVPIVLCCSGASQLDTSDLSEKYGNTRMLMKPIDAEAVVEFARESSIAMLATI